LRKSIIKSNDQLLNQLELQSSLLPELEVRVSLKAKYAQLKVLLDGRVELVIPKNYKRSRVSQFLLENRSWLEKTLARYEQYKIEDPERYSKQPKIIDLQACQQCWSVNYLRATKSRVRESSSSLCHLTVEYTDESLIAKQLKRWLNVKAKAVLVPWLHEASECTHLKFDKVSIRGQKTRWGSCSSEANISLNRSLLFLPEEIVKYVLIHELCHTQHLNHSQSYWLLVNQFDPEYQSHEKQLNSLCSSIPLWVY